MNLKKYLSNPLITGTLFLTFAGTASRFMGFFFRIFLNDILGPVGLGLYQLTIPLMSLCLAACCNGFQTATSKLVAEHPSDQKYILSAAIFMSSVLSLIVSFLMYTNARMISLYMLGEQRCIPLVRMISFSLVPACIHSCINGYYYGLKKTAVPSITQLIEQSARIGSCYLVYIILQSENKSFLPVHSICGIAAGEFAATLFSISAAHFSISRCEVLYDHVPTPASRLFKQSCGNLAVLFIPMSLNYFLISFSSSVENMLIPKTLVRYGLSSSDALSLFGTLTGLSLPVLLFPGVLCSCACVLILPAISEANACGQKHHVSQTVTRSVIFGMCFGLSFTFIFFCLSDFIGNFLFGSDLCGYFIRKLCWLCPMLNISGMLCSVLHGLGMAKQVLLVNLLSCCIRISMIALLVPLNGIDAYLWALLASWIFLTAAVLFLVQKKTGK